MREYVVNRPDAGAMRTLLERESDPEGVIVRLAWLAGLSRDEIAALCWEQVSFMDERLELPDRTIPMTEQLRGYLWRLYQNRKSESPYVVVSERYGDRMQPESISRLARQALDRSGQKDVRLMYLRHDWIIHQLETEDWPTVARLSGVEVPALQARFSRFVTREKPQSKPADEGRVDEFKLWKVLQAEKRSPAGLALWLAWQMGLQAREIAALTWEQVDFEAGVIRLEQREEPLTNAVRRLLWEERDSRPPQADPHVLLTEQSHKPLDLPRLSRLTRAALIRGGLEHVHLMDLRRDERRQSGDTALLERAAHGAVSRGEAMELLGLSRTAAYARLRRLTEEHRLIRIGGKYYLPGTVVPPEEQPTAVQNYLEQAGFAYRQEIARLLHVQPKQCTLILKRMVTSGQIAKQGQKYLPQEQKVE